MKLLLDLKYFIFLVSVTTVGVASVSLATLDLSSDGKLRRATEIRTYIAENLRDDLVRFFTQVGPDQLVDQSLREAIKKIVARGIISDIGNTDAAGRIIPMETCNKNRPSSTLERPDSPICFDVELLTSMSFNTQILPSPHDLHSLIMAVAIHEYARHFKWDFHDFEFKMINEVRRHYLKLADTPLQGTNILPAATVNGDKAYIIEDNVALDLTVYLAPYSYLEEAALPGSDLSPQEITQDRSMVGGLVVNTSAISRTEELTLEKTGYPSSETQGVPFDGIRAHVNLKDLKLKTDELSGEKIKLLEVFNGQNHLLCDRFAFEVYAGEQKISSVDQHAVKFLLRSTKDFRFYPHVKVSFGSYKTVMGEHGGLDEYIFETKPKWLVWLDAGLGEAQPNFLIEGNATVNEGVAQLNQESKFGYTCDVKGEWSVGFVNLEGEPRSRKKPHVYNRKALPTFRATSITNCHEIKPTTLFMPFWHAH